MRSPRSCAMRSATLTAEMRRGCVHMMRAPRPLPHASSSSICGTWAVAGGRNASASAHKAVETLLWALLLGCCHDP